LEVLAERDADQGNRMKPKRIHKTTTGRMEALASSILDLSSTFQKEAEMSNQEADLFAKAVQLLEREISDNDECALAVRTVTCKPERISTYLGFTRDGPRSAWLKMMMEQDNIE
jgi:hypothetical protein